MRHITSITILLNSFLLLNACGRTHNEKQLSAGGSRKEVAADAAMSAPEAMETEAGFSSSTLVSRNKEMAPAQAKPQAPATQQVTQRHEKKIIKDGSLSMKSREIVESKRRLDALLKSFDAYYETENFQNDEQRMAYDLRIRIPSANFEKLLADMESGNEEINNKNIAARDVTAEFVDIESRLTTKRAYLKRYTDLLSKAGKVQDVLDIEAQIRVLQEEIESQEGQLKYLSDQVSFSTLSVNLYQEKEYSFKPDEEDPFFERVKTAFSRGWTGIVTVVLGMMTIWPFFLVGLIVLYVVRRVGKKIPKG